MRHADTESLTLLANARSKDLQARETLLQRFQEPLVGRIRMMMGKEVRRVADSTDFLQQVMVDFLEASSDAPIRSDKELLRWLTAVARNNLRDAARKKRAVAFESFSSSLIEGRDSTTPSTVLARHEESIRLAECLEKLRPEQREVIVLHRIEGLSLREAADCINRSYEATKKLHFRAMVQLGSLMTSNN